MLDNHSRPSTLKNDVFSYYTQTENSLVDDCGYLLLLGEHDKTEGTDHSGEENPYYRKLEEHDKVETATDSGEDDPYYYKLEQVHE